MNIFLSRLERGLSRLYRACGMAAAACMVFMAGTVLLSIISRLLSIYVAGLIEYSGYAMAAGSFLALAYTFGENSHIRVELLLSRLGPAPRRAAEIWCLGVASIVTVFLAWFMGRLVYFSWKFEERSEGADAVVLWIPQSLVMIGALVMAIAVIHQLLRCLLGSQPDVPETQ